MTKALAEKVAFARFCVRHAVDPSLLAKLIDAADKSKKAYERGDNVAENKYGDQVKELAKEAGFEVYWAGLYPTLRKGDSDYYLP